MSVKLTDAQQKAAKDAFNSFDKKGEGQLKVGEIAQAMKKLGHNIKPDWLEKMEDMIDTEGTGYIGLEEFTELIKFKIQEDEDEKELRQIFHILDKEKRGEINTDQIRWILKELSEKTGERMSEEEIDDMIADVDTDGSGWVDYEEFSKLMMS